MNQPEPKPDDKFASLAMVDGGAEWTPPPWPENCPQPGIYPDIPYPEYHNIPAVRASHLKICVDADNGGSPLHMRAAMDGRMDTDSRARKFGRAVHCRLLEPAEYRTRFAFAKPCCAKLKRGPRKGEGCGLASSVVDQDEKWYCGKHKPKEHVSPVDQVSEKEAAQIEKMAASIFRHKVVSVMHSKGGCEVTLIWSRDGIPCKARLDKLIHNPTCIVDIKKIQVGHGTEHTLQTSVRKYGYDFSAWWYREAVKTVLNEKANVAWIFAEDNEPYDVVPQYIDDRLLEIGRMKVNRAWGIYLHCLKTNNWPGCCPTIGELSPAAWEAKTYGVNQ